jgi:hypothetical protein
MKHFGISNEQAGCYFNNDLIRQKEMFGGRAIMKIYLWGLPWKIFVLTIFLKKIEDLILYIK